MIYDIIIYRKNLVLNLIIYSTMYNSSNIWGHDNNIVATPLSSDSHGPSIICTILVDQISRWSNYLLSNSLIIEIPPTQKNSNYSLQISTFQLSVISFIKLYHSKVIIYIELLISSVGSV